MRAFVAALAVVVALAASIALADITAWNYNTTDCSGAATTETIITGTCVSQNFGSGADAAMVRTTATCNSTAASLTVFLNTDTSCSTALLTMAVPLNTCTASGLGQSMKVSCSAGAVAFAAVAFVVAVLAMML